MVCLFSLSCARFKFLQVFHKILSAIHISQARYLPVSIGKKIVKSLFPSVDARLTKDHLS
jgi:hypothetical protein